MPQIKGLDLAGAETPSVLILGLFSDSESIRVRQYYAHSSNVFWPLIGTIYAEEHLPLLTYEDRMAFLSTKSILLWDLVAEADRSSTTKVRIRSSIFNDVFGLLDRQPSIHTVIFNGMATEVMFRQYARPYRGWASRPVRFVRCLSTNTLNSRGGTLSKLLENWRPHLPC